MKIILNGTSKEFTNAKTVADIVTQTVKEPKHIIAELNGQIIDASQWSVTNVKNDDVLELVTFVGGG